MGCCLSTSGDRSTNKHMGDVDAQSIGNHYTGSPKRGAVSRLSQRSQDSTAFKETPLDNQASAKKETSAIVQQRIEKAVKEGRKVVKAIYEYIAPVTTDATSASDMDLNVGDVLEIISEEEGWWLAKNLETNKQGYIPGCYVELYDSIELNEWYHGNITREESERRLNAPGLVSGTFLIRTSKAESSYALSILNISKESGSSANKETKSFLHYRIRYMPDGRCYLATTCIQKSLKELIEYYSTGNETTPALTKPCPRGKPILYDLSHQTVDHWQIDRHDLTFLDPLGHGKFGEVHKGKWQRITVAIKSIRGASQGEGNGVDSKTLLDEAAVMKRLRHPRLVALYAVCLDAEPFYIVTEFLSNGDLKNYLQRCVDERTGLRTLTPKNLLDIASQVVQGMAYIHDNGVIHRDLAARNVLVGADNSVKVGDFGLAQAFDDRNAEPWNVSDPKIKIPIKWTAPEVFTERRFSFKSDVWSYGILLVELYTFGETPYKDVPQKEIVPKLNAGYRHPQPPNCSQEVYDMMLYCWKRRPEERPTFEHLEDRILNLEEIDKQYQETT